MRQLGTVAEVQDVIEKTDENESSEMVISIEEQQEGDVLEEKPEDTSWDDKDAKDTKVDLEEEKKNEKNNKNSGNTYYIKINYTANVVTVYTKDSDGNYTVPVKAIVCSTGKATPTGGVYKMSNKYRWHQLNGGVYGQYCSRITGHILFHSVPYANNTPDSLKYVAYDKLGTKASAGCIRLTCQDAMWIYNNCSSGTYVEFYSSSDPGPLGKPSAKKISSNEKCRNWDPTDPTPGNPWHTYVEQASTTVEEKKNTQNAETPKEKSEETKQKEDTNTQSQNTVENTQNSNTNTTQNVDNKDNNTNTNTNTNANTNINTNTNNNTNTVSNNNNSENKANSTNSTNATNEAKNTNSV